MANRAKGLRFSRLEAIMEMKEWKRETMPSALIFSAGFWKCGNNNLRRDKITLPSTRIHNRIKQKEFKKVD